MYSCIREWKHNVGNCSVRGAASDRKMFAMRCALGACNQKRGKHKPWNTGRCSGISLTGRLAHKASSCLEMTNPAAVAGAHSVLVWWPVSPEPPPPPGSLLPESSVDLG